MSKKYILIIEDDEDIQDIYREILDSSFDCEIAQCYDGSEGLESVKARKPDMIILDLLMPKMNGDEFLRTFRGELNIKDVPVVVCSVNQTLARQLQEEGLANSVLPKLFQKEKLTSLVQEFLSIPLTGEAA